MSKLVTLIMLAFTLSCSQAPATQDDASKPAADREVANSSCPIAFTKTNYCGSITWLNSEKTSFTLKLWAKGANTLSDPAPVVKVFLWMPSMGHGSAPVTIARETNEAAGAFRVSNVNFIMPGSWEVHVQFKNGEQILDEAIVKLEI